MYQIYQKVPELFSKDICDFHSIQNFHSSCFLLLRIVRIFFWRSLEKRLVGYWQLSSLRFIEKHFQEGEKIDTTAANIKHVDCHADISPPTDCGFIWCWFRNNFLVKWSNIRMIESVMASSFWNIPPPIVEQYIHDGSSHETTKLYNNRGILENLTH